MIRLGLCCKFSQEPIKFRVATATHLKKLKSKQENPLEYLNAVIDSNIKSLQKALEYCASNHIGSFRIGSDFFPVYTHPEVGYNLEDLPDAESFQQSLEVCRKTAQKNNTRLTFHPSQFILLSSPNEDVIEKSIADIEYHTTLAKTLGADVINIHVGGAYNDKSSALKRVIKNFSRLSKDAQSKLTLENDDKIYSPIEVIPLCKDLNIPFVYDVHHHRCYRDELSVKEATELALKTWKTKEPLFHISSPLNGWQKPMPFKHHDFIDKKDFPQIWKELEQDITVEVEAKAKELAVKKLHQELQIEKHKLLKKV